MRRGEQRDVVAALAQRRHAQLQRADAVVEVLAEAPLLDERAEVVMRRRDQADVDGAVLHVAEAAEAFLLEHLQQAGLHLRVHVADLVEEDRAAVRRLRAAPASSPSRR